MMKSAFYRARHPSVRKRNVICASAIALAAAMPVAAIAGAPAQAAERVQSITLPAQPLGQALVALSRQTGISVFASDKLVAGKLAPAVSGTMTPQDALGRMLQGTGLGFSYNRDGTYIIVKASIRKVAMVAPTPARVTADVASSVSAPETGSETREIIVSARKRDERLRDVPVSIQAISGSALEEKALVRVTDLTTVVPNFTMSLGALVPSTSLRGFGTYGAFAQSVGKFIDNVSYGRDLQSRIPLFDVERLEVLRGPQVLLYGNSTTAGALNITTKKPGHALEADVLGSYEFNHQEAIVQGGATLPINDWASVRIAGFYQDLNRGWLINDFTGHRDPTLRNRGMRGTLRLTPTGGPTITLKAEYTRTRDDGSTDQQIHQSSNPSRQLVDVVLDDHRDARTSGAPYFSPEFLETRNQQYQADVQFETGIGTINSTTSYMFTKQGAALSTAAERFDNLSSSYNTYKQFGQELRLSGNTGMLDYNIGGYFERYNLKSAYDLTINFPAFGLGPSVLGRYLYLKQINNSYSGFADLTAHLTDKLSVSAGARYTILHQNNDQISDALPLYPHQTFDTTLADLAAQVDPSLRTAVATYFRTNIHTFNDIKRREEHFQPQIVVQYRPNNDVMIYGKFVRGAKQGGVDVAYGGTTVDGAKYAPEYARSFEAGIKGITADHMLEYSLVAFATTFTDLQTSAYLGTAQFVTNVGKARTRGIEAEVTITPTTGLRINATANYLDAKFLDFPGGVCTVAQTAATPVGTLCKQDLSGKPTPLQSKYSGTLNVSYGFDAGGLRITPAVSVTAKSSYNVSTNIDPLAKQNGLALVDLNLGVAPVGSGFKASVFVRNLTDHRYKEYGNATPLIPGGFYVYASRGRSIGVQLGAKF